MAFTPYPNNYNFHEETLSDRMVEVKNNSGRTVLHNELVYLDGYFGEVCEFDGIKNGEKGFININSERIIKTTQVKGTLDDEFKHGAILYFIPQTALSEGLLTDTYESGNAIAVGTVISADEDDVWVTFRPFIQGVGLNLVRDPEQILGDMVKAAAGGVSNTVILTIDKDATGGGLAFANVDTGLKKDDVILDIHVICDETSGSGKLTVKHGGAAGAAITNGIACATAGKVGRTTDLIDAVVTDDGLVVVANGATDEGRVVISYVRNL